MTELPNPLGRELLIPGADSSSEWNPDESTQCQNVPIGPAQMAEPNLVSGAQTSETAGVPSSNFLATSPTDCGHLMPGLPLEKDENDFQEDGQERDPVEQLADEFVERLRRGDHTSVEHFATAYPHLADRIRELFPIVAAMEGLRIKREQSQENVSLGPVPIERLGDFRIIRKIGRGGMGVVFEAEQESLKRRVAVKVLPPLMLQNAKQLERFRREAQTVARLHHTNIVQAFGVGEHNGIHYFVMQYIDGVGFDQVLKWSDAQSDSFPASSAVLSKNRDQEPSPITQASTKVVSTPNELGAAVASPIETGIDPDESEDAPISIRSRAKRIQFVRAMLRDPHFVSAIFLQVTEAVSFAHRQGVLHCDLKPGNLLLDSSDHVWIVDFGLAKVLQRNAAYITGQMSGTLRYMAPELLFGKRIDVRCDVYSLGITFYELLTGRTAFGAGDRGELVAKIEQGELGSPRDVCPALPRDLESIVLKSTATQAEDRYQTVQEFADDLKSFLKDRPIRARPSSLMERVFRWGRRNRVISGLTLLTFILFWAIAGIALYGFVGIRQALTREAEQRERAESTSKLASDALDKVFLRFRDHGSAGLNQPESELASFEQRSSTLPIAVPVTNQADSSKETVSLLQELLTYYDQLAKLYESDPRLIVKAIRASWTVGDIHQRLGQYELAIKTFEEVLQRIRSQPADTRLILAPPDPDLSNNTLVAIQQVQLRNEIGIAYRQLDQNKAAEESHQEALRQLTSLASAEVAVPAVQFELARTNYLLARRLRPGMGPESLPPLIALRSRPAGRRTASETGIESADGRLAQVSDRVSLMGGDPPIDGLREAIRILRQLVSIAPKNPRYRQLLAICYREASADHLAQQTSVDTEYDSQAISLLNALVDEFPDVADYRFDLMEAYAEFSVFGASLTEPFFETARSRLMAALEHGDQLVADHPQVDVYTVTLVHAHFKLSVVLADIAEKGIDPLRHKQLQESEQHAQRAVELQRKLLKRHSKAMGYAIWLAYFQSWQGRLLLDLGRPADSRATLDAAIDGLRTRVISRPEFALGIELLGNLSENLSETLDAIGDHNASQLARLTAEDWWRRAQQHIVKP